MSDDSHTDMARALAELTLAFEDVATDIRRGAEAGGLTLSEVRLLDGISRGITGARLLSRRLRLDEGHVSRMVQGLKRAGLITAMREPADSRRVTLALTAAGAARLSEAVDTATEVAAAHLAGQAPDTGKVLIAALAGLRAGTAMGQPD